MPIFSRLGFVSAPLPSSRLTSASFTHSQQIMHGSLIAFISLVAAASAQYNQVNIRSFTKIMQFLSTLFCCDNRLETLHQTVSSSINCISLNLMPISRRLLAVRSPLLSWHFYIAELCLPVIAIVTLASSVNLLSATTTHYVPTKLLPRKKVSFIFAEFMLRQ